MVRRAAAPVGQRGGAGRLADSRTIRADSGCATPKDSKGASREYLKRPRVGARLPGARGCRASQPEPRLYVAFRIPHHLVIFRTISPIASHSAPSALRVAITELHGDDDAQDCGREQGYSRQDKEEATQCRWRFFVVSWPALGGGQLARHLHMLTFRVSAWIHLAPKLPPHSASKNESNNTIQKISMSYR